MMTAIGDPTRNDREALVMAALRRLVDPDWPVGVPLHDREVTASGYSVSDRMLDLMDVRSATRELTLAGGYPERVMYVLWLEARGWSISAIARDRHIARATVRADIRRALTLLVRILWQDPSYTPRGRITRDAGQSHDWARVDAQHARRCRRDGCTDGPHYGRGEQTGSKHG